jgi:hypothetical protein
MESRAVRERQVHQSSWSRGTPDAPAINGFLAAEVSWVGYANDHTRARVEPLLQEALRRRRLYSLPLITSGHVRRCPGLRPSSLRRRRR